MVSEGLRPFLLSRHATGRLEGPGTGSGASEHPVCGDRIEIDVRVRDGVLDAVACRIAGCPASHAVASVAAHELPGTAAAAAPVRLRDRLQQLGGLESHERHAESMVLRALLAAVAAAQRPVD